MVDSIKCLVEINQNNDVMRFSLRDVDIYIYTQLAIKEHHRLIFRFEIQIEFWIIISSYRVTKEAQSPCNVQFFFSIMEGLRLVYNYEPVQSHLFMNKG